jgi:hypothetical protein
MVFELIPNVMARLQLIRAAKRSLLSRTAGGRRIVADYFSCQWQLEDGIRHGQALDPKNLLYPGKVLPFDETI